MLYEVITLRKRILGCGDGPASFNSYITKNGGKAVSIDPIYQMKKEEIADRISETYEIVIEQTRNNIDKFNWTNIRSVDELGEIRMKAMKDFLLDFEGGKEEGRYIHAELPRITSYNVCYTKLLRMDTLRNILNSL